VIEHPTPLSDWLVVLPVILALAGSAFLLAARPYVWVQKYGCGAILAAMLVSDWLLLQRVLSDGPVAMTMGKWLPPFGISFVADAMGAGFALVAAFVACCIWLSMQATVPESAVRRGIYPLVLLLLAGVGGAVLTGDLFNLYVWFEVMLIASFGLIALAGNPLQLDGAIKYGVVNLVGTALFLLALGLFYGLVGTLNMADVIGAARKADSVELSAIALLFALAFGIKAAIFPLGAWLPASYHTPPAPISALVGALVTKVGIYALFRVLIMLLPETGATIAPILTALAVATMLFGPLAAIAETNLRRAIGFMLIGGVGVAVSCLAQPDETAMSGGITYMLHAALTLGALYLVAGVIEQALSSAGPEQARGLYANRPVLSLLFLALVFAVSGIPPFLGFWPKLLLLQSFLTSGNWLLVFAMLANALLTLTAGARLWSRLSWGPAQPIVPARGHLGMLVLTISVVVLGAVPGLLVQIGSAGARGLLDPAAYVTTVGLAP
jgi:multicomponent Na+:H+ antiporter subunit D